MDTRLAPMASWQFLDNLREGVILLEVDGAILYVNSVAQQLLKLYPAPATLRELYNLVSAGGSWSHFERLLGAPAQIQLNTTEAGTVEFQSEIVTWDGHKVIQLLLNKTSSINLLLDGKTAEQLHQSIENLRAENKQLRQRAEQLERLEIISEASRTIAGSLEAESVLTAMGEYMLQAVDAVGYTVYGWSDIEKEVEVLVEFTKIPDKQTQYSLGTYAVTEYPLLKQLLNDHTALVIPVSQPNTPLPGKPLWLAAEITYKVILLPIFSGGDPFGVIALAIGDRQRNFSENELQLLTSVINQAGVALEKVRLFEDIFERESFLAALGRVSLAINATLDLPTVLSLICQESRSIFNADGVYIWELEADGSLNGLAAEGPDKEAFIDSTIRDPNADVFAQAVARAGESRFINHLKQKKSISVQLPHPETIEAVMGIPLAREGSIMGVLVLVDRREPDRFGLRDIDQANAFAVQVAIAIQNAKLVTKLRTLNEELDQRVERRTRALGEERDRFQMLLRITTELSSSLDEDRVLTRALELVNGVVNATQGVILLIDEATDEFVFRAAFGMDKVIPPRGRPSGLMRDEGLAGWIVSNREAVILEDAHRDHRWMRRETSDLHRSVLGVPLVFSGEVIGVLMLFHKEKSAFTEQQLRLVEAAATQVSNAVYNAHLYLLIRNQAERLGAMLRDEQITNAKMQAILESIADGVLVADEAGKTILVNLATADILGVPREQMLGQSVYELSGLYSSAGNSWVSTVREWANNSDQIEERTFLDEELYIEDEEKFVSVRLAPVFAGGQFFGTVSIFRDRTKEVEVDRVKSEFVSTVSHELRTPLTSIKGYTDLMLMGATGAIEDGQKRYLQVIKNNADRLQELVNDLLDISRLETGKTKLDLRPVDVPQIIEQVVDDHLHGRVQHEQKRIETEKHLEDSLPLVNADYTRVTQILTNLVDNAFNYTPNGGCITVSAKARNGYVYISVSDTGIGIAKESLERIFDRFYRSEDIRVQRVAGTGLGLPIVKSLVEMHGGELHVESNLDEGSTFTFNLPVVKEDSSVI